MSTFLAEIQGWLAFLDRLPVLLQLSQHLKRIMTLQLMQNHLLLLRHLPLLVFFLFLVFVYVFF